MKKIITIALLSLFCVSFAACGQSNESKTETGAAESSAAQSSAAQSSAAESSAAESSAAESSSTETTKEVGSYTLEEYAQLVTEQVNLDSEVYKAEAVAENGKIVYRYTYLVQISDDNVEKLRATLTDSLNGDAVAEAVAQDKSAMAVYCGREYPIVMSYLNKDGTLIAEKEF